MPVDIQAELLISNATTSEAWRGQVVEIEAATIQYPARGTSGLASVQGLVARVSGTAGWGRRDDPCQLIAIALSSAVNLVVGLPWKAMGYSASVNARQCEGSTLRDWEPYELVRFATRPIPGAHRVTMSNEGLERIERLVTAAMGVSGNALWGAATQLAAFERATSSDHPYDRVRDLWSGFDAMLPPGRALMVRAERWLQITAARDRTILRGVLADVGPQVTLLLRQRRRLAKMPGTGPDLESRLAEPLGTPYRRLITAVAAAYVVRNQLYHGRWSHLADSELPVTRAAARLLWRLMRADIEFRLTGRYLPTIRGTTEISAPL